ncbi:DUF305 domain-containing protein [Rhodococcus sp. NPDC060176]|uniref:DUF305 domain-containing protein n=1 Tax=Rhodococcus sp. NPDC060176 TaxID=3347062 RepID=UPI003668636C
MTATRSVKAVALVAAALMLLVLGAALRPLFAPENHTQTAVLSETEIGFVHDMATHHQQALFILARLSPDVDQAVTRLAQQIDDVQRTEIGVMLGWLRLAGVPPNSRTPMGWMEASFSGTGDGHHHPAPDAPDTDTEVMPGMATTEELERLGAAQGSDAEVMFLQLMERHHRGGIAMAQAADALLESGPVKQSARDMINTQSQESGLMTLMLGQRGAQPLH